jgi:hypothetical protein
VRGKINFSFVIETNNDELQKKIYEAEKASERVHRTQSHFADVMLFIVMMLLEEERAKGEAATEVIDIYIWYQYAASHLFSRQLDIVIFFRLVECKTFNGTDVSISLVC